MNFMGEPEIQFTDTESLSPHLSSDGLIDEYVEIWNNAHRSRVHGNENIA